MIKNDHLNFEYLKGLLASISVVICWTGFNIISRLGAKTEFTPYDLAALRFGISGILTLPAFVWLVPIKHWPKYFALAVFGGLGYALFIYSGFSYAPSAHAGVFVNGGIPFWAALLVGISTSFNMPRNLLIAFLISLIGLIMIGFSSLFGGQQASMEWLGDLLFFIAALCWAIFGYLIKRWGIRPHMAVFGIASFSLVIFMPIYLAFLPKKILAASLIDIATQGVYQGIIAALVAAGLYGYSTQKIGTREAAMLLTIVPGLSALGGYLVLNESLSVITILGIIIVTFGGLLGSIPSSVKNKNRSISN